MIQKSLSSGYIFRADLSSDTDYVFEDTHIEEMYDFDGTDIEEMDILGDVGIEEMHIH